MKEVEEEEGRGKNESPKTKEEEEGGKTQTPNVKEEEEEEPVLKPTKKFAFQCGALLTTVLLFTGAVVMIILYVNEIENLRNRHRATKRIQSFIGCYNDTFRGENETERMGEAMRLVGYVNDLRKRNHQLWQSLNDVVWKLYAGWKPFGGNLYFFSEKIDIFSVAQTDCENRGSLLIDITTPDEQDFVEAESQRSATTWIGLRKRNLVWTWLTGELLGLSFWAPKRPMTQNNAGKDCVYVYQCANKRQCWYDSECTFYTRNWICKIRPDPRWVMSKP